MEEPLCLDHGLVGAPMGKGRFWGLEPFPDHHSMLKLKQALLITHEFDAIYDVDPGLVTGGRGVLPGRYIESLLRVFKQFTHTLPSG